MARLFTAPALDLDDQRVVEDVHALRAEMASSLRAPRRWTSGLRRTTQARAIQGSNSIEGYSVTDQDALAAVEDEAPLTADQRTWAEIVGYRRVLTYVLGMATSRGFRLDAMTLRSMHFMLLEHDLSKAPGQYRTGPVFVHDDAGPSTRVPTTTRSAASLTRWSRAWTTKATWIPWSALRWRTSTS